MARSPLEIKSEFVILCEGKADQEFFRKILLLRDNLPRYDLPFPNDKLFGNSAFGQMLVALRGNRLGYNRVKGILIVADSADDPDKTFKSICRQIEEAGLPAPEQVLSIARSSNNPAIGIMLIPDGASPGGLESLLVREISARYDGLSACVESFFQCGKIDVNHWSPEKRDKARFHCMVAAVNESDPSKSASYAFKTPNPLIDVTASCFDDIAQRLRDFSMAVLVPEGI